MTPHVLIASGFTTLGLLLYLVISMWGKGTKFRLLVVASLGWVAVYEISQGIYLL